MPASGHLPQSGQDARIKSAHDIKTKVIAGLDPAISFRRHRGVPYYVYIATNRRDGTLYVGVTNDIVRRTYEHRNHQAPGFTDRYNLVRLVYFEAHDAPRAAIQREKNIKHWPRAWKIALIERDNPEWRDLFAEIASR